MTRTGEQHVAGTTRCAVSISAPGIDFLAAPSVAETGAEVQTIEGRRRINADSVGDYEKTTGSGTFQGGTETFSMETYERSVETA